MSEPSDQVRYAYPKYRVFIFGVEVTDDCVAINIDSHIGGTPNTCQITILNQYDKYIVTTSDMAVLSGNTNQINLPWTNKKRAASQKLGRPGTGSTEAGLGSIKPERKRSILTAKFKETQSIDSGTRTTPVGDPLPESTAKYYGNFIKHFPMSDGAPIFNVMDPVRVAMRDPFNPNRWYWHFAGFVSDLVDNSNENNAKQLTILVEDVTKLFRYTRLAINPGVLDHKAAVQSEDIRVQSFYTNFLRGFTLPEVFFTLIFGPDKAGTEKVLSRNVSGSGSTNMSTALKGIGHFSFDASSYCTFGSKAEDSEDEGGKALTDVKEEREIKELKDWQALIDHEVQPSDLYTMATQTDREISGLIDGRAADLGSDGGILNTEDVVGYIGIHPQEYPVDGGKLMMLIPNSLGTNNARILLDDIIQAYPMNSEFHSAGAVMEEIVERIQFAMYCTPKGDLVIEPPLYDFDPDDFGLLDDVKKDGTAIPFFQSGAVLQSQSANALGGSTRDTVDAVDILARGERLFPGGTRGPFGDNYIILKRDTYSWESAFVDEKVYTIAVCPWSIVQNWPDVGDTGIVGDLALKRLEDLIPLYGIRPIPITPRGYIASREAATLYASITLDHLNADAHTVNVQHVPNIQLWLNRPIYVEGRNMIGTTKQISHSITWGAAGTMDTTSDLYAVRTWNGMVSEDDPTQPIFTRIGAGHGSEAIDYAVLWKTAKVPAPSSLPQGSTQTSNKSTIEYGPNAVDLPTQGKKVQ